MCQACLGRYGFWVKPANLFFDTWAIIEGSRRLPPPAFVNKMRTAMFSTYLAVGSAFNIRPLSHFADTTLRYAVNTTLRTASVLVIKNQDSETCQRQATRG
ncbi:unnamed protein product [Victoria cruziana]